MDKTAAADVPSNMDYESTTFRKRTFKTPNLDDPSTSKLSKSMDIINVQTHNSFEILSDTEDVPPLPPLTPKPTSKQQQNQQQTSPASLAPNQVQIKTKRERVPTITIKWTIPLVRSELSRSSINSANFLLKQINGATVVKLSNLKDYEIFLKRCIDHQVPHFTHTVDNKKPLRIVLLGLPNMPAEEVKEALAENNVFPDEIKPMKVTNARLLEHNNFVLHFPKGSVAIGHLREIKHINNVIVKWVYYDAKRYGPTQCRRCQAWGHGSSNCHLQPACVKCAGAHETSACPVSAKGAKVPDDKLKCINCDQPHAASFTECPTRIGYILSRPVKKSQTKPVPAYGTRPNNNQRYSAPQQQPNQWPVMPHQQHHHQLPQQLQRNQHKPPFNTVVSNTNVINSNQNYTVHPSIDETPLSANEALQIFQQIIPIISSGKSRSEQLIMIFELATQYINKNSYGP
jgi:hypothetical protein